MCKLPENRFYGTIRCLTVENSQLKSPYEEFSLNLHAQSVFGWIADVFESISVSTLVEIANPIVVVYMRHGAARPYVGCLSVLVHKSDWCCPRVDALEAGVFLLPFNI